ncbi:MAG: hypothetical protein GEV11_26485 [Streptosporangiales bacterium]|nr:hypothetical protein [Streptosporangiales bacterium]
MAMERHLRVPGLPVDARVEVTGITIEELERAYEEFDQPDHTVELINGRLIVSPTASRRHGRLTERLGDVFFEIKRRNGWEVHTNLGVYCAVTRDRMVPDLMVLPREAPDHDTSHAVGHGALLVAEVVSPGSAAADRDLKPRAYAQAGVPMFLLIDPVADKPVVTLMTEPGGTRYGTLTVATQSETLRLPEPFDLTLDLAELFGD